MSADKWIGLHLTRTLVPEATFALPSGRVRSIQLTKRQTLELLRDAAHALSKIEEAEKTNRDREAMLREVMASYGTPSSASVSVTTNDDGEP